MRLLVLGMAVITAGCGPKPDPQPPTRREPSRRVEARRTNSRAAPQGLAGCPVRPSAGSKLPAHIRKVVDLGRGLRLVAAGQRASELPPCTGRCPAPQMVLALVAGDGTVCWRVELGAEHRRGPVGREGKTLWVAGPKQLFAVSWQGKLLATSPVDKPALGPISLVDGGAALMEASGHLVTYRASGKRRWHRKPRIAERPVAIAPCPKGGFAAAFPSQVRSYDADGVLRLRVKLPEITGARHVAARGRSTWVWSTRGAYRVLRKAGGDGAGSIRYRLPSKAPRDGRVFAAAVGPTGRFYAISAEKGFYPVKLVSVTASDALDWTRPFTGSRPRGCRMTIGAKQQLAIRCANGRAVVRTARGITRFDEVSEGSQVVLGEGGRFAVAFTERKRDMTYRCWVRRFGPTAEAPEKQLRLKGRCKVLWMDGKTGVYVGARKVFP